MNAKLIICGGDCADREVSLANLPLEIGRGGTADVRLCDRFLSRNHCRLEEVNGVLWVRDLASTHGTFVNGRKVAAEALHPGDHLRIGLTEFVAEYEESFATLQ